MEDSIIFNSPTLILLYCLALLFLFLTFTFKSRYVFPLLSLVTVLGTTVYALLLGCSLWEAATVLMIFLFIHMVLYKGHRP